MPWQITIKAGNGSTHQELVTDDFMPPGDQEPTALEVLAKGIAELAEIHRGMLGGMASSFAFKPPLTIILERVDD